MVEAIFVEGVEEVKISGLTQWDRGQMVQIICPDLPSAFQVHFAKRKEKTTTVVQATSSGYVATVAIPDVLLQDPFDLYAYLYFDEGLTGETVKSIRFPIKPRQKPDDYVIDLPQEQPTDAEKVIIKMMAEYVDEVADHIVEGMQVEAETLEYGLPANVQKEVDNGVVKLVFGIPVPEATVEAVNAAAAAAQSAQAAETAAAVAGETVSYGLERIENESAQIQERVTFAADKAAEAADMAEEAAARAEAAANSAAAASLSEQAAIQAKEQVEVNAKKVEDFAESVPSITTADNGKFLRVVNGAWAADDEILVQMGLIVEIVKELIGKFPSAATIEFHVYHQYLNDWEGGTVTYEAEDGMTWAEWVASEYNTSGFRSFEYEVRDGNFDVLYTDSEDYIMVDPTDAIIAGHNYYCESDGS